MVYTRSQSKQNMDEARILETMSDLKDQLSCMFNLKDELSKLFKEEIATVRQDVNDLKQSLQSQVHDAVTTSKEALQQTEELQMENRAMKDEIKLLQTNLEVSKQRETALLAKYDAMSEKTVTLESYSRRENLIFIGINKSPNEDCSLKVRQFMTNILKLSTDVVGG